MHDHIIVGGGLSGCVLASRMREYDPNAKILLIEAGEDTRERPGIRDMQVLNLGGELDWQYESEPVAALGGRRVTLNAGKGLGGGSLINSGKCSFNELRLYANNIQVDGPVVRQQSTTNGRRS